MEETKEPVKYFYFLRGTNTTTNGEDGTTQNERFVNETYKGITDDLRHRLRQHNGLVKGGALSTTLRKRKYDNDNKGKQQPLQKVHDVFIWKFWLTISGFRDNTQVRRFEHIAKDKRCCNAYRNKHVPLEIRQQIRQRVSSNGLQTLLEALNLPVLSGDDTPISQMQLSLEWWTNHVPEYIAQLIPPYIHQSIVQKETKQQRLQETGNREKHKWPTTPW